MSFNNPFAKGNRLMKAIQILLVAAFAFVLASCGSNPKLDASIQQNLPRICASVAQLHSAFVIIASTGTVKARLIHKENAAFQATQAVCRDPSRVNSSTALITLAESYAALIAAMKEVQ